MKPTPVVEVNVDPEEATVTVGKMVQLEATPEDVNGNHLLDRGVSWSTSDPTVATVNAAGAVVGQSAGEVTITATSEGANGTAEVTVTAIPVALVTIRPPVATLAAGSSVQLEAVPKDSEGNELTHRQVTWSSSDVTVATVDDSGLVAARVIGVATITATCEGVEGSAGIVVTEALVASITVAPTTATIAVKASVLLVATAKDSLGNELPDRVFAWSSSDDAVAEVSDSGRVVGRAAGRVTIVATSENVHGTATITVTPARVASVAVSPPSATVTVAGSVQLTATPKDDDGDPLPGRVVTWSSGNPAVATVDSSGLVTGRATGVATITAECEGVEGVSAISVRPVPVASVAVSPASATVIMGSSVQLAATPKDAAGEPLPGRVVTWSSSNSAVATVDGGLVVSHAVGTATITATSEGKNGTASITVRPVPVASVEVSPPAATVPATRSVQLAATPRDSAGNPLPGRAVTWSSSNTTVATVSTSGLVSGKGVGAATITATSEGVTGSATVTVIPRPTVASVAVSPSSATILVGAERQFEATPRDAEGDELPDRPVTWSSSNSAVATVDSTGLVTGRASGSATIAATSEGVSGTAAVTVQPRVASVAVTPSTAPVAVGRSVALTATPKDAAGNPLPGRTVTWSSSNASVATVSSSGLVTGRAIGTAVILATSEGVSGTATVTVVPPVVSVTVTPPSATVVAGRTVQLAATPRGAAGDPLPGRTITWSSSNASVASVSASGLVTALAAGAVDIRATCEGVSGTATITILAPVASVAVTPPSATVVAGGTVQLTASPRNAGGDPLPGRTVTWSSSNAAAASVSESGLVTANVAGTVTITATCEGVNGTATITVLAPVSSVVVTPPLATVVAGRTVQLAASPRDAAGNPLPGRTVTWSSSDAAVASVNGSGLVTGHAAGTVTITATCEGVDGTATVTVLPPVASVDVTPPSASVVDGGTIQLTAVTRDAAGNPLTGRTVTWSSSNAAVASVSASGLVTGREPGNVTITATSEGVNGTAAVTVTPIPVASVAVAPTSETIVAGRTVQLTATARSAAGDPLPGRTVTWSSSNAAVASVSASGLVTAHAAGTVTITATCEGVNGTATITVLAPVSSVVVTPPLATVVAGRTVQLAASPRDAAGNPLPGRAVTWSSSNAAVASVNGSGLVTGHAAGAVTITATCEGVNGTATVTVLPAVSSVVVTPPSATVVGGGTVQLTATPRNAAGNPLPGRTVTWSSSNTAVASVNATGFAVGRAAGVATITATCEGVSGSATIEVLLFVGSSSAAPEPSAPGAGTRRASRPAPARR